VQLCPPLEASPRAGGHWGAEPLCHLSCEQVETGQVKHLTRSCNEGVHAHRKQRVCSLRVVRELLVGPQRAGLPSWNSKLSYSRRTSRSGQ